MATLPGTTFPRPFPVNVDSWFGSRAPTVGRKSADESIPVVLADDVPIVGTVVADQGAPGGSPWPVDGSSVTQPISAVALPLPTGAATEATLSTRAASTQLPPALASGRLVVDGSQVTQPVSAAALPLPAGAATEATLTTRVADATITARLGPLGQATAANSAPVVLASNQSAIPITDNAGSLTVDTPQLPPALVGGRLVVDGSGVTQPISAAALPLPAGAATEATLAAGLPPAIYTYGTRRGIPVTFDQGPMLDAGGRLRVSEPATVFDSKLLGDAQPLIWDDAQTTGAGTSSTYSVNTSSVTLAVSNLTAGTRVRQTFRRLAYQPGKGQRIELTGSIGNPTSGIVREVGQLLWGGNNGVFFSSRGQTNASYPTVSMYVVIRSGTSGVAVDTAVPQSAWNLDRLNGSGPLTNPSGVTADWNQAQIFVIDYTWLSIGTVLYGLIINNALIYVHAFQTANVAALPWMTTPNLPLCFTINNDGTGPAASLTHICTTVSSEGGLADTGYSFGINRGATALTTLNNADLYPLTAYRLRTGYEGATVRCVDCSAICISNAAFAWYIIKNPTVVGTPLNYVALANSAIEIDVSTTNATTVTGGLVVATGVSQATQEGVLNISNPTNFTPGVSILGVRDQVIFAVQRLTGTAETFYGACGTRQYN